MRKKLSAMMKARWAARKRAAWETGQPALGETVA
jgi:hypothetical protein